jgi:eukaryotic-like serine/threonine-protein kinase
VPASRRTWPLVAAAVAGFAAIAAAAWSFWPGAAANPPPTTATLTTYRGQEWAPTLSPDGSQVAFVWNGEQQNNDDIYVKPIDTVTPLRLTSDPLPDLAPAWSPSGRELAFVRLQADGRAALYVTPPIPGSERKVADLRLNRTVPFNVAPTWTPDGRWLVVAELAATDGENGLFRIGVESAERRPIVTAPLTSVRYRSATVSPAGDAIAYIGCSAAGIGGGCDVWIQSLGAEMSAQGSPRRMTDLRAVFSDLDWMPDGRSLVANATMSQGTFAYLWQIPISGGAPTRLDWLGSSIHDAALSSTGRRLVATRDLGTVDIWRFDLASPGSVATIHPVSSTLPDLDPEFSPDGSKIAFASARSGVEQEIWIAQSDGSGAMLLTRGAAGRNRGSPRWSHDGKRIVFDSASDDAVRRAYVMDATGGAPRLVSDAHANYPSWSHDDKWIYFASNRSGRVEVWRVAADGGAPEQVTRSGGTAPRVSPDGRTLYYRRGTALYATMLDGLDGGPEQLIADGLIGLAAAYLPFGNEIFVVVRPEPSRPTVLELRALRVTARTARPITRFEAASVTGLSVAPDGKTVLLTVFTAATDLILVENFR